MDTMAGWYGAAQLCLWPAVSPFVTALPVTLGAPGYDGGGLPGPTSKR
eukprot:SAG31_NODE_1209_length_9381_cov_2.526611_6_plen_48_part_00